MSASAALPCCKTGASRARRRTARARRRNSPRRAQRLSPYAAAPAAWQCWPRSAAPRHSASEERFVPRPLAQHPHALANGQADTRPMLGGALNDAARFVQAVASVDESRPTSRPASTSRPYRSCGRQGRSGCLCPRGSQRRWLWIGHGRSMAPAGKHGGVDRQGSLRRSRHLSDIHADRHETVGVTLLRDIADAGEIEVIADKGELIPHRHVEEPFAGL
jgi:hypothetical protein